MRATASVSQRRKRVEKEEEKLIGGRPSCMDRDGGWFSQEESRILDYCNTTTLHNRLGLLQRNDKRAYLKVSLIVFPHKRSEECSPSVS